ncbi:hypothetical protein [Parvularcula sp. LCG005]|uniref:hypothetical protein n=1 Tax=Parvularcula sp. LCG005 TaxID=3078805 RepID=UPI0029434BB6|nr:hypothetical protein [Parvularcula sp. LCG005]WOI54694.1 hypothetical protein RUI03_06745 [Parvularcula sp. LCG005]
MTREIYQRLGDSDYRRRMAAERVFRELRKGESTRDTTSRTVTVLPHLSPTLR